MSKYNKHGAALKQLNNELSKNLRMIVNIALTGIWRHKGHVMKWSYQKTIIEKSQMDVLL
jgi:hypothetical protein